MGGPKKASKNKSTNEIAHGGRLQDFFPLYGDPFDMDIPPTTTTIQKKQPLKSPIIHTLNAERESTNEINEEYSGGGGGGGSRGNEGEDGDPFESQNESEQHLSEERGEEEEESLSFRARRSSPPSLFSDTTKKKRKADSNSSRKKKKTTNGGEGDSGQYGPGQTETFRDDQITTTTTPFNLDEASESVVVYECVPCMLPKDEAKRKREKQIEQREGMDLQTYKCEMCRVGNGNTTDGTSEALSRVYNIDRVNHTKAGDEKVYSMIADEYNKTIYDRNMRRPDEYKDLNLKKWTSAGVKYHLTICEKGNSLRLIYKDLDFIDSTQEFLREQAVFYRKSRRFKNRDGTITIRPNDIQATDNGSVSGSNLNGEEEGDEDAPIYIDNSNHHKWLLMSKQKLELLKFKRVLEKDKEKDSGISQGSNFATRGMGGRNPLKTKTKEFSDL